MASLTNRLLYSTTKGCVIIYLISVGIFVTHALFGGILRGCGRQFHVAIINVCSYYLLGLLIGLVLVYVADMGALGFWIGCTVGTYTQVQYNDVQ